ncbi:MAG: hypothetical protein L0Y45_06140 [Woeseiaceae bacterium]|nr:hypothetical protein [Woeseiaceae bacterium]
MPVNRAALKALMRAFANPAWPSFTWFGMTAGISLLESPARFSADTLSRAAALDLGRIVFSVLNKAELITLVVLLSIVRISGQGRRYWAECALLALIMIAQSVWLLPELSARSAQIVAGADPGPSFVHAAYASLELLKLALLLVLGFRALAATGNAMPSGTKS